MYSYRTLTIEQDQVYSLIDESGADGIWSRTLKAKTNLHDAVIRSAIKVLETRSLIRDMKSVEHPTRKMYIKASMRPSERATGGSWYTDSELDEEFVAALCKVLFDMIWKRSFYRSSSHHSATRQAKKVVSRQRAPSDAQIRQELEIEEDDESARLRRFNSMLPMPPHYQGYPTLTDLTAFIDGHPITQVTLPESDIQQLMEILVFDDMVEPVPVLGSEDNVAYRATRRGLREVIVGRASAGNGFTTVPCGACPVFDLCEEGGPVCPSGCVYFRDWLVS